MLAQEAQSAHDVTLAVEVTPAAAMTPPTVVDIVDSDIVITLRYKTLGEESSPKRRRFFFSSDAGVEDFREPRSRMTTVFFIRLMERIREQRQAKAAS